MIDEQERKNEEAYEKGYLNTAEQPKRDTPELQEGETSPCPYCLDDVTENDDISTMIVYTIFKNHTGSTNHMEIYHAKCYKKQEKDLHEVQSKRQHGK